MIDQQCFMGRLQAKCVVWTELNRFVMLARVQQVSSVDSSTGVLCVNRAQQVSYVWTEFSRCLVWTD